eukprot:Tbor_TRINITY_DN6162_c0_g1::TRINITY_DN6162_c0_g1_i1::g.22427::m.22427
MINSHDLLSVASTLLGEDVAQSTSPYIDFTGATMAHNSQRSMTQISIGQHPEEWIPVSSNHMAHQSAGSAHNRNFTFGCEKGKNPLCGLEEMKRDKKYFDQVNEEEIDRQGKMLQRTIQVLVQGMKSEQDIQETEAVLAMAREKEIRQINAALNLMKEEVSVRRQCCEVIYRRIAELNDKASLAFTETQSGNRPTFNLEYDSSNSFKENDDDIFTRMSGTGSENNTPTTMSSFCSTKLADQLAQVNVKTGSFSLDRICSPANRNKYYATKQERKINSKIEKIWLDTS